MSIFWLWFQFGLIALTIFGAGYQLCLLADQIAEETGWGKNLIGFVMLATITSLPELTTGVSAVLNVGNPNLALGDVLGSCLFNLFLVVVLDFFYHQGTPYSRATQGHILLGSLGIILISFVGLGIYITPKVKSFDLFRLIFLPC